MRVSIGEREVLMGIERDEERTSVTYEVEGIRLRVVRAVDRLLAGAGESEFVEVSGRRGDQAWGEYRVHVLTRADRVRRPDAARCGVAAPERGDAGCQARCGDAAEGGECAV
jgi:hypothetical protein